MRKLRPEAVDEDRLRRGDDAQPRRARELRGVGQAEMLDAVREAARVRAEALVDVEHLVDRDVADRVGRDAPAGARALSRHSSRSSLVLEAQHALRRRRGGS